MKIATWNVNSLKVRLPHVLDLLSKRRLDVLCVQETKTEDANFPRTDFESVGFHAVFSGQKAYNGVAIFTRTPVDNVAVDIHKFDDEHRRVLAATLGDTRFICAYVPNGQSVDSPKYEYKLRWLAAFERWLAAELATHPKLAVLGDYNVAPEDRDVYDPVRWAGEVLCSPPERAAFKKLLDLGLKDSFRLFEQPDKSYTWWDYRLNGFKRNLGLRIDHILVSPALASACTRCEIDLEPRRLERPSDHAPVIAEFHD